MTSVQNPMNDLVSLARDRRGPLPALRDATGIWTYEDLGRAVDAIQHLHPLHREREGARRWVLDAPPSSTWVAFYLAAIRAGHVAVPLGRRLAPAEREALIARVCPDFIVTSVEIERWSDILAEAVRLPGAPTAYRAGGETWVLTSGSTGSPRIARLTWDAQVAHARISRAALGLTPRDTWWADLPLNHVGGLGILVRGLASGCQVWLHDRVDPVAMDTEIDRGTISRVSVVPTTYRDWLDHRRERPLPSNLASVLVGGAGCPASDLARCERALPTYGLTEAGSHVTLGRPGMHATEGWGDGGWPLPGIEIHLENTDPGGCEEGILRVRSPGLFIGYHDDPDATRRALVDGWLVTGDLGRRDEDGRIWIRARVSELIVTGGENVTPAEVEQAIARVWPDWNCVVVGVPDPRWGHVPAAVFEGKLPGNLTLEALRRDLNPWLARHKHPRRLVEVERLPRLSNGKLDRRTLTAIAMSVTPDDTRCGRSVGPDPG